MATRRSVDVVDFDLALCPADGDSIRARLRRIRADGVVEVRMVIVDIEGAATGAEWLPVPSAVVRRS